MTNENKTKILYVITKSNWGGAQKYVYDFATSLSKDKYDVSVALGKPRPDTIEGAKGRLYEALDLAGIKMIPIEEFQRDINIFEEIIVLFKLISIFKKEKPDVIHVNSSKAGGLGVVAGFLSGVKKRIFTVHGFAFNEPRSAISKSLIYFFSWLTVRFATKVICMSKDNYEEALGMTSKKDKVQLIYNGIKDIDLKEKTEARQILIEQIRSINDRVPNPNMKWVGTISELTKNKGVRYLIGAISRHIKENPLEPINAVIIGDGEDKGELEELIKSERVSEYVFLTGFIPDAVTLLNAFDIITLTSLKEGNPFLLLEAGLAKKAVIGSNIKGIDDILENDCGILVEKGDVVEISKEIQTLLTNTEKRELLGQNLFNKVTSEFSFDKTLEKTESLYIN